MDDTTDIQMNAEVTLSTTLTARHVLREVVDQVIPEVVLGLILEMDEMIADYDFTKELHKRLGTVLEREAAAEKEMQAAEIMRQYTEDEDG